MDCNKESKLRKVLNQKGITPAEFARIMGGRNSQTINNWLNRGVPHHIVTEVARKLGVAQEDIAQGTRCSSAEGSKHLPESSEEFCARFGEELNNLSAKELAKVIHELSKRLAALVQE